MAANVPNVRSRINIAVWAFTLAQTSFVRGVFQEDQTEQRGFCSASRRPLTIPLVPNAVKQR